MSKKRLFKGTALITGGAKRIGQTISLKLSDLGYKIALHYHQSKSDAQKIARQIKARGGICEIFECDLSHLQKVSGLIVRVSKKSPDLNLLINNASIFEKSLLRHASLDSLNRHFNINFKTPFILCRDFANIASNGHIINILDTNIVKNHSAHATYLLSKKTLWELTKMAAIEFAPHIRVNGVAPGLILAPSDETEGYLERLARHVPLKRKGSPGNIIQSIEFLIKNDYLTGQIIFNDGGEHLL